MTDRMTDRMTAWEATQGGGRYQIQFETDCRELYKLVERVCQLAIDKREAFEKGRTFDDGITTLAYIIESAYRQRDALMDELRGRCFACAHVKRDKRLPGFNTCEHIPGAVAFLSDGKSGCKHWEWKGTQSGEIESDG